LNYLKQVYTTSEIGKWEDEDYINDVIKNFDPFLSKGQIIKVRLSENGKKLLQTIKINRPKLIDSKEDIFEFEASEEQIKRYFTYFLDDATVIEPLELKEWFIEKYENALREQKRLIDQRKENVKDMIMNVPRVNPDYGKDMDKDLFNARDNALTEQLNKDFPRNNPYKNINPDEGLNMLKPQINREKSQNINEQLKKLRERVGN